MMPYKRTGKPNGRPRKLPAPSDTRPVLTQKAWTAIRFELANPAAHDAAVARAAGVSRTQVLRWRRDDHYRSGREWMQSDLGKFEEAATRAVRQLNDRDATQNAKRDAALATEAKEFEASREREFEARMELLWGDIKKEWSGIIQSPLDGRFFTDPDDYFNHVKKWRDPDGQRPHYTLPEEHRARVSRRRRRGFA